MRSNLAFRDDDDGEESEFRDFVQELIACEHLEGAALGIAKLVVDRGRDVLTPKQTYVFDTYVLGENTVDVCDRCSNPIPWCEMYHAVHYRGTGLCGWCQHMVDKND